MPNPKQSKNREDWKYQTYIPTIKVKYNQLKMISKILDWWFCTEQKREDKRLAKLLRNGFTTQYAKPNKQ